MGGWGQWTGGGVSGLVPESVSRWPGSVDCWLKSEDWSPMSVDSWAGSVHRGVELSGLLHVMSGLVAAICVLVVRGRWSGVCCWWTVGQGQRVGGWG